ncbi:MAG: L-glutamate gamma-semialdehyde dehydrogenase [Planctomycetota bacterium]|nr:MAG: L-glutamate gamma-semialdehyde dehydrogenase [Planctomycetota bacterium]
MTHGVFHVPAPKNEPVLSYAPGSPERAAIQSRLTAMAQEQIDVPILIGGEEIRTGRTAPMVMPHDHAHVLGHFHKAGPQEVARAIDAAEEARADWIRMPWEERAAIFLRAAELLATTWRDTVNAATMLNQSKTVHQAEIDAACELIDFWRINVHFMERLYAEQPESAPGIWNRIEHRPLDGFVFAITPFNFTSIAGNLPTAPAMLGNTCVWKPASTSVLSNYYLMKLLEEAGLPPGVINFVPGSGGEVGDPVVADRRLAGIHFTGSTDVFQGIWRRIGDNIREYAQYPRIVGETGGKNFVFAHASAAPRALATALVRGAFEYQGQKCSAASRAYIPQSLWGEVRDIMGAQCSEIGVGDVQDFHNFMGAVIDASSYSKLSRAIDGARADSTADVVIGGEYDDATGWFVKPTVVTVKDPRHDLMRTEFFGPLLSVFVYDDARFEETLELCASTSAYGLTGAIFGTDRAALRQGLEALRFAAGNFYVNDKPTGAVVGQQPFGGSRASGTNDKAGSMLNLMRWVSQRTIKETFVPPTDFRYPFMDRE